MVPRDDFIAAIAASDMASAAILGALIRRLTELGLLKNEDVDVIFDKALLNIETQEGASPISRDVISVARKLVEKF
jgi:hypothetical protein